MAECYRTTQSEVSWIFRCELELWEQLRKMPQEQAEYPDTQDSNWVVEIVILNSVNLQILLHTEI